MSVNRRALQWKVGGDTGISSETIWAVMMGVEKTDTFGPMPPSDPSDFGRCYRLLQFIPEWRERLPEVATKHPMWGPLVREWDELTAMYEDSLKSGSNRAPQLYRRMQELNDEGLVADGWIQTGPGSWRKNNAWRVGTC